METDPDLVALLAVALPPVIFPPVVCATAELMTPNSVMTKLAPARIANIANILIVFNCKYEMFTNIYNLQYSHRIIIDKHLEWEIVNMITLLQLSLSIIINSVITPLDHT